MRVELDGKDEAMLKMIAGDEYGYPPSVRDLCDITGLNLSSVHRRLSNLEAKGVITKAPGLARSLRLARGVVLEDREAVVPDE